jgi:hypothetical protein
VPAEGFNLDHVVVSTDGIYVIETKTDTKPHANAKVVYGGESVTVAGHRQDRDLVKQGAAAAVFARKLLEESTGKGFPVRGAVVYPGWWIEQTNRERRRDVWANAPSASADDHAWGYWLCPSSARPQFAVNSRQIRAARGRPPPSQYAPGTRDPTCRARLIRRMERLASGNASSCYSPAAMGPLRSETSPWRDQ